MVRRRIACYRDRLAQPDCPTLLRSQHTRNVTTLVCSPRGCQRRTWADVERKAVAALTSLLDSRPSIASASSPRSSLSAGFEASFHSLSQYAQSSARTTTAPSSLLPSAESSFSTVARVATSPRAHNETLLPHELTTKRQQIWCCIYTHPRHPHVPLQPETETQKTRLHSGHWVGVVRFAQGAGCFSLAVTMEEVHCGAKAASLLAPYRGVRVPRPQANHLVPIV